MFIENELSLIMLLHSRHVPFLIDAKIDKNVAPTSKKYVKDNFFEGNPYFHCHILLHIVEDDDEVLAVSTISDLLTPNKQQRGRRRPFVII